MIDPTIPIEDLCDWGEPRTIITRIGRKVLRKAEPTEDFWDAWEHNRDVCKDIGLSCSKNHSGVWEVAWWQNEELDNEAIEASSSTDCDFDPPAPDGLEYLGYQKAGIKIMLGRPNNLLADEMGLGKTVQVLGLINADDAIRRVLVICPASLKLNWKREAKRWLTREFSIVVIGGKVKGLPWHPGNAAKEKNGEIVIINYDIVGKWRETLEKVQWGLIVCDEAHYMKSATSQRKVNVMGGAIGGKKVKSLSANRKILLTGTPVLNRPIELWNILRWCAPHKFTNYFGFRSRYCGGRPEGASNLEELSEMLRNDVMIRRLKKDVLSELPAKRREVLDANAKGEAMSDYRNIESSVLEELESVGGAIGKLPIEIISRMRKAAGMAKVKAAAEHVKSLADSSDGKFVVFGHHKDVMNALEQEFRGHASTSGVARIDGSTSLADRDKAVRMFQEFTSVRVFLGNIQAAGVGLTLTASSHVVFVELPWTPAELTQAEDRCHRIGQHDSVNVQIMALPDSLDARMAELLVSKARIVHRTMDGAPSKRDDPEPEAPPVALAAPKRQREQEDPEEPQAALLRGLRIIAGKDPDHARIRNGIGFSLYTAGIGHSLARCSRLSPKQAAAALKILTIHRRQLPKNVRGMIGI